MMEDTKFSQGDDASLYPKLAEDVAPDVEDDVNDYQTELVKIEDEIATLKQVLTAKEQRAAELRKMIGITPLSQLKAELNKVQSTQAYQKTSETLKNAGQATASVFSSFGSSMSSKFSEMKNSNTYKSFEEKMEGVGSTIMAKVQGRERVGSVNSGDGLSGTNDQPVVQQPVTTGTTDNDLPI